MSSKRSMRPDSLGITFIRKSTMVVLLAGLLAVPVVRSNAAPARTFDADVIRDWHTAKEFTLAVAEAMPADKFGFRVTTQVTRVADGSSEHKVLRQDFSVPTDSGIKLFVREVRTDIGGPPVLLIHGGGPGGVAIFDLEVPGYSLASNIALAGYDVYLMDVRGFGRSSRPAFLRLSDATAPPAVTSEMAVQDIGAVVNWIRRRVRGAKVILIGHASGGHWAGMYTSRHNSSVSHLVLINSMYGVKAPWPLASGFQDSQHPGAFDPHAGPCRLADATGLLAGWNRSIPGEDKSLWRDPRVADTYVRMGLASDPTASTRNPPSVCIPGAFRLDHFLMAQGKRFWDAKDIHVPTLVVRGERDHWSRPEDLEAFKKDLVNAPRVRTLIIPDATHFFFLDRPEHGMHFLMQELTAFLLRSP